MKRTISLALTAVFLFGAVNVSAQEGLSSGQRVVAPSTNPEKQAKTCPHCGIRISGVTHPSDHYEWCPYYRPSGGGRSSGGGRVHYSAPAYTQEQAAISVAASLAGTALANWLFSEPSKPQEPTISDKDVANMLQKDMREDEAFWTVGDYEIVRGDLRLNKYKNSPNAYAYGLKNTRTGKFLWNPNQQDKKDIKEGTVVIYRDVDSKDFLRDGPGSHGGIRLFQDPDGAFGGKPLVGLDGGYDTWVFYKHKWKNPDDIKGYRQSRDVSSLWFLVDENDELKRLRVMHFPTEVHEYNFFRYPAKGRHYILIDKNGKQGLYYARMYDEYANVLHKAGQVVPIVCEPDTIERVQDEKIGSYYTCKVNGKDTAYVNKEPFNLNILNEYNDVTIKEHDDFGTLVYVKERNTWGALLPSGQVIMPLTAGRDETYWANIDKYVKLSYTSWLRKQVNNLLQKGKYEKQADYEARMKDQSTIQKYLAEKLNGMGGQYLQEKTPTDGSVFKPLNYDSEREVFTGNFYWNKYEIPVPIKEAEAFEKAFDAIAKPALKTAKYRVLNDVIAIDDITFTMPNGKKYHGRMAE